MFRNRHDVKTRRELRFHPEPVREGDEVIGTVHIVAKLYNGRDISFRSIIYYCRRYIIFPENMYNVRLRIQIFEVGTDCRYFIPEVSKQCEPSHYFSARKSERLCSDTRYPDAIIIVVFDVVESFGSAENFQFYVRIFPAKSSVLVVGTEARPRIFGHVFTAYQENVHFISLKFFLLIGL